MDLVVDQNFDWDEPIDVNTTHANKRFRDKMGALVSGSVVFEGGSGASGESIRGRIKGTPSVDHNQILSAPLSRGIGWRDD